jgi:hypothetical protein
MLDLLRSLIMKKLFVVLSIAFLWALGLTVMFAGSTQAAAQVSTAGAIWTWDPATEVGTSRLVRSNGGLSGTFHGTGLPAGQAMTLWFIVFNNPDACNSAPCSVEDLLFNEAAQGDFLWGGGNVIGGSGQGNFGGHLSVGDASRSGFMEIGMPERALGLLNPFTAEVHLAVHSHGPAVPGPTLREQLNSFAGGCDVFLGPFGIAAGPEDVPTDVGECSTIQVSIHYP